MRNVIPKKILITGGCGFIGSNFINYLIKNSFDIEITNFDCLTYAGNLANLQDIKNLDNYKFIKGDIRDSNLVNSTVAEIIPDVIINFAAESHVDRSIKNPNIFLETNVGGTINLLNASLDVGVQRFVQISTDEVYGSLGSTGNFTESMPLKPNSPYSASKASSDNFVRAYNKTYGLETIITRCSNNYGPYQFPEKLIPLVINNAKNTINIPIYGDGLNIRDWIFVNDHCSGIWKAIISGKSGEIYNFGGNAEIDNLSLVKLILEIMGKEDSLIRFVKDRPGHDLRYSIDFSKSQKELDWSPKVSFSEGLKFTVDWYLENVEWVTSIINDEYLDYYKNHYVD